MPRKKKAHELTTEEVLRKVFHKKVARHLRKAVKELDQPKKLATKRQPSRKKG